MSRTFTEPDVQAANEAGCIFYDDPATLRDEQIDPLLRDAVRRINSSGWVWTAESCQGHPDSEDCWAGNTRPMLRLVCREDRAGDVYRALCKAAHLRAEAEMEGEPSRHLYFGFQTWPNWRRDGWFEVLVYIPASIKGERDAGCRVYDAFAELVTPEAA